MYRRIIKPLFDRFFALLFLCLFSPVLLLLTLAGAIVMKGNPFFSQLRIGRSEQAFRLIKFRTMTNAVDASGRLLPDDLRLTAYGRFLRKSSMDELPELLQILSGKMSFIGPRPLLPEYLPYYRQNERLRHSVLPGLTGLAQVNGRTNINSWEERFAYDLAYVRQCSFSLDLSILFKTVMKVLRRKDVMCGSEIRAGRLDVVRRGEKHADCSQTIQ